MRKGKGIEAEVVRDLKNFLAARGWRAVRMETGFVPGAGSFGEKGIADWLFLRYMPGRGLTMAMWIEAKPPGHKPVCRCKPAVMVPGKRPGTEKIGKPAHECRSCGQARWKLAEEARGALVLTVSYVPAFISEYQRVFGWLPEPKPQAQQMILEEEA